MTKREFSFVQLDVFTSRPLEGNQLAVFTDARGLSDDEMQKLARETNLCETTFILPRDRRHRTRRGTQGPHLHRLRRAAVSPDILRWGPRGICANTRATTRLCST